MTERLSFSKMSIFYALAAVILRPEANVDYFTENFPKSKFF